MASTPGIDFPILANIEDIAKRFIQRDEIELNNIDEKTLGVYHCIVVIVISLFSFINIFF
jgi:hypothetical protein